MAKKEERFEGEAADSPGWGKVCKSSSSHH